MVGGFAPVAAGLAVIPLAAANAVGATTAPRVSARWGNRWSLTSALALFSGAVSFMALVGDTGAYPLLVAPLVAAGYGAGIVMTLGADSIMSAADPDRSGEAAAIQETSFELGAGLGVAVLGTVLTASYRLTMPGTPGLSGADRDTLKESFSSAEELVSGLEPPEAGRLLDAAGAAYDHGFTTVAVCPSAALAATAVLAAALLRPRPADH